MEYNGIMWKSKAFLFYVFFFFFTIQPGSEDNQAQHDPGIQLVKIKWDQGLDIVKKR